MNEQITAFVLVRSGRMRDGLLALLGAIPLIGSIQQLEHDLNGLKLVTGYDRVLVLLEASLTDQELCAYIQQIKKWSLLGQYKCIVLADNSSQARLAHAAGADGVLLAGFPAVQFFATVENLFAPAETYLEVSGAKNGAAAQTKLNATQFLRKRCK